MISARPKLCSLREKLSLTMRDGETASRLARRHSNEEYLIPLSRLSDFETKGITPSIQRLYSLAVTYRREFRELLNWYGVDLNQATCDAGSYAPPPSRFSSATINTEAQQIQIRMDPNFDARNIEFRRMIEQWGSVPLAYREQLSSVDYAYRYIGSRSNDVSHASRCVRMRLGEVAKGRARC